MSIMKINSTVSLVSISHEDRNLDVSDGSLTIQARGSEIHLKVTREDATVTAYITTENELDDAIAILCLAKQKYHKYD